MNMIQHSDGVLLNGGDHTVKHIKCGHLVLNNRISLSISSQTNTLAENLHVINVIHPLAVNALQKDNALKLTQLLWLREFGLLRLVKLHSLLLDQMLHLILFLALNLLGSKRLDWDDLTKYTVEFIQIPLFRIYIIREAHIHSIIYNICDHLVDGITHVLAIQYLAALFVDDLTLLIINLVVIKKILTDTKVVKLDFSPVPSRWHWKAFYARSAHSQLHQGK